MLNKILLLLLFLMLPDLENGFKGSHLFPIPLASHLRAPSGRFYIPLSKTLCRLWLWGRDFSLKCACNGATGRHGSGPWVLSLLLEGVFAGMERKISHFFVFNIYTTDSPKFCNLIFSVTLMQIYIYICCIEEETET